MKTTTSFASVLSLSAALLFSGAPAAHGAAPDAAQTKPAAQSTPGLEAAKNISMITGVAISPLLGVGTVGAYEWWHAAPSKRAKLRWFAQPWFWVPALLLVVFVGLKDILGTAAPAALKKPFDVAETFENKISGLIAAGAFVPLIISVFPHAPGTESNLWQMSPLASAGFAAIDAGTIGNALLVPFGLAVFAVVWLASHAINILILISPFTIVDTALKSVRIALLGLLTATATIDPYVGALFSAVIIFIAYFIAGWSWRLTIFGTVYAWDFATRRSHRFQPGAESNWMFTARKVEGAPIRTYGRLLQAATGILTFEYRPWLLLAKRSFTLAEQSFVVGRGLFYPEIARTEADRTTTLFILPPRYKEHEEAVARAYGIAEIRDVGLRKGIKGTWAWFRRLLGFESKLTERESVPAN
jgi:hypothetical protein